MPRAGLSPDAVVDAAVGLLDSAGPEGVTLAAVAAATGVATPSLYKHIDSLDSLRRLIAVRFINDLADRLTSAVLGRSQDDALRALMIAYRAYALDHPNRYAALPQNPVPDPGLAAAGGRVIEVILAVLRGYGLEGHDAIHAARSVRAAAHGFASLQTAGAFQLAEDLDTSYELLIGMLTAGLGALRKPALYGSARRTLHAGLHKTLFSERSVARARGANLRPRGHARHRLTAAGPRNSASRRWPTRDGR